MDRRKFIRAVAGSLATAPLASVDAQRASRMFHIGVLSVISESEWATRKDALLAGLRDAGYVEGKNLVIEYRYANGNEERLQEVAAELVRLKVDLIVTHATAGALAATRATTTIPIVMAVGGDAVATGLVPSLARPGGNLTGSTILIPEINVKRLELLRTAAPRVRRLGVLAHRDSPSTEPMLQLMEAAARSFDVQTRRFEIDDQASLPAVFSQMGTAGVDAVFAYEEPTLIANAKAIASLATKQQLPSTGFIELAEAGGLIGFGADTVAVVRHAAVFVDKIFKGAKPGDLPIEQATTFQLVVNAATARALALQLPQSLLVRADRLIQ